MKTLNIHQTKTHLSKLLEEVQAGEGVVIAKAGKPIAKLVPYTSSLKKRKSGILKKKITESKDAWSYEVDADIAANMNATSLYLQEDLFKTNS